MVPELRALEALGVFQTGERGGGGGLSTRPLPPSLLHQLFHIHLSYIGLLDKTSLKECVLLLKQCLKTMYLLQSPHFTNEETEAHRGTPAWPRPQLVRDRAKMYSSSSPGPLVRKSHHSRCHESLRQQDWAGINGEDAKRGSKEGCPWVRSPPPLAALADSSHSHQGSQRDGCMAAALPWLDSESLEEGLCGFDPIHPTFRNRCWAIHPSSYSALGVDVCPGHIPSPLISREELMTPPFWTL